jgi:hypothetical protein
MLEQSSYDIGQNSCDVGTKFCSLVTKVGFCHPYLKVKREVITLSITGVVSPGNARSRKKKIVGLLLPGLTNPVID